MSELLDLANNLKGNESVIKSLETLRDYSFFTYLYNSLLESLFDTDLPDKINKSDVIYGASLFIKAINDAPTALAKPKE